MAVPSEQHGGAKRITLIVAWWGPGMKAEPGTPGQGPCRTAPKLRAATDRSRIEEAAHASGPTMFPCPASADAADVDRISMAGIPNSDLFEAESSTCSLASRLTSSSASSSAASSASTSASSSASSSGPTSQSGSSSEDESELVSSCEHECRSESCADSFTNAQSRPEAVSKSGPQLWVQQCQLQQQRPMQHKHQQHLASATATDKDTDKMQRAGLGNAAGLHSSNEAECPGTGKPCGASAWPKQHKLVGYCPPTISPVWLPVNTCNGANDYDAVTKSMAPSHCRANRAMNTCAECNSALQQEQQQGMPQQPGHQLPQESDWQHSQKADQHQHNEQAEQELSKAHLLIKKDQLVKQEQPAEQCVRHLQQQRCRDQSDHQHDDPGDQMPCKRLKKESTLDCKGTSLYPQTVPVPLPPLRFFLRHADEISSVYLAPPT